MFPPGFGMVPPGLGWSPLGFGMVPPGFGMVDEPSELSCTSHDIVIHVIVDIQVNREGY